MNRPWKTGEEIGFTSLPGTFKFVFIPSAESDFLQQKDLGVQIPW